MVALPLRTSIQILFKFHLISLKCLLTNFLLTFRLEDGLLFKVEFFTV